MQESQIPISHLRSPKSIIDYRGQGPKWFYDLVQAYRLRKRVDPIEVCQLPEGLYYIQNGVRRAKAAEVAGLQTIGAYIFRDSKPSGPMLAIKNVRLPF